MKCNNCGQEISNDSNFCEFCGAKINNNPNKAQGWVDLGLPSGTLWKDTNEEGLYTFIEATKKFGGNLPTKKQFDELDEYCKWTWKGTGYKVMAANGESIFFPSNGCQTDLGFTINKKDGYYWAATLSSSKKAWYLNFDEDFQNVIEGGEFSSRHSVRLVQNCANTSDSKTSEIDFEKPENGGCYIATAVYGSYDCPEVWTLRRYRDNVLDSSWYGRLFIRCYYAISPTLVKWFGETNWFKRIFRKRLSQWVYKLNEQGFQGTPYRDKY